MTAAPKFMMLKLDDVVESPLNPRKEFDKTKLAELTASVKERGVLEPILVRPNGELFEVAAGARRFRAAKAAELTSIPAMVRVMTDSELLMVALLENAVRHDISPLEEGDTLRALQRDHGFTIEKLIQETGKSRTVVFQRMKLAELQGESRAALAAGHISASVAELLARLPTIKAQDEALAKLRKECHYRYLPVDDSDDDYVEYDYNAERRDISRMPFRDAKYVLDETFRLVLAKAPFDTKTDNSVAPACTKCPKRTGADKETFKDVKADTCLDAVCWNQKKSLEAKLLKSELEATGGPEKRVVKESNIFDQYRPGELSRGASVKYAKTSDEIGGKTVKELLGKQTPMVTVIDKDNKTHNLVDRPKAVELLKKQDPEAAKKLEVKKAERTEDGRIDYAAQHREEEKQRKRADAIVKVLMQHAGKLSADEAIKLFLETTDDWNAREAKKLAGIAKPSKPAERVRVLVAFIFNDYVEAGTLQKVATALKADLSAIEAQVDGAEKKPNEKKVAPAKKAKKPAAKKPKAKKAKAVKKGKKS